MLVLKETPRMYSVLAVCVASCSSSRPDPQRICCFEVVKWRIYEIRIKIPEFLGLRVVSTQQNVLQAMRREGIDDIPWIFGICSPI